jgi:hypothetical protein
LDTHARVLYMQGKIEEAIMYQLKAIKVNKDPDLLSILASHLSEYLNA